jgi:hypothetical protein
MFDAADKNGFQGDSMPEFNTDSFADVPSIFNQGLTPEQIKHRIQLYQIAFEKARETVARRKADQEWMRQNGLTFGDGI